MFVRRREPPCASWVEAGNIHTDETVRNLGLTRIGRQHEFINLLLF